MSRPLEGKVAIITGGSRGIGAGIAQELSQRGASIVITYVSPSSSSKAEALLDGLKSEGCPRGIAVQADCPDTAPSATKIVAETIKAFGPRIDIVVNNAANGSDQTLSEVDTAIFDTMFHTNVLFPLLLIKECTKYLSPKSRIVNISSSGVRAPMPYSVLYTATKSALESITRSLAAQFGNSHEATVNAINPGPISTDMWNDTPNVADVEAPMLERTLAAKRIGRVDDVAPIVAFLCDPSARWITGNVTCANGGLILS